MKIITNILLIFMFAGCLENLNEPKEFEYSVSADMLVYFETNGDFINSIESPAFITADEIYSATQEILILDLRIVEEYNSGHIDGSLNIKMDDIIDYFANNNVDRFSKIIIISSTGQKASYVTSLLRLKGYDNVYSLKYGMSIWHSDFYKFLQNNRRNSEFMYQLRRNNYAKPAANNNLPIVDVQSNSDLISNIINDRINLLLSEKHYNDSQVDISELDNRYRLINQVYENSYIVCYGDRYLYSGITKINKNVSPPTISGGHPRTAYHFTPSEDFKSSANLLSLPTDKTIFVYSYNGQQSSNIVAYLRLLGYEAKSIRYGAENMFYSFIEINTVPESLEFHEVRDYPYVK